jgi:hypothetical protein
LVVFVKSTCLRRGFRMTSEFQKVQFPLKYPYSEFRDILCTDVIDGVVGY